MPISNRGTADAVLAGIGLDRDAAGPLYRQLTAQLRGLIEGGRLPAGTRLPASRALAEGLGISRTTALQAIDQLAAEGYLEGRRGAGTFVAALPARPASADRPDAPPASTATSDPAEDPGQPFRPGIPDTAAFPARQWARHLQASWRAPGPALLTAQHGAGLPGLRAAIAGHLRSFRGLHCDADNILITAGLRDALALVGHGLLPPGRPVAVEEPGFPPLRSALQAQGRPVLPCTVDSEGLQVGALARRAGAACAVTVTPSRHYPLGITLPLARRLALLDWAEATGAWILEDDYDSEFRYQGQPVPPLAALDRSDRVLYLGSFSKVMFPSLRLGYLVAGTGIVARLAAFRPLHSDPPSLVPQPALAAFIEGGGFARHLRRMRRLYQVRQASFLQAFRHHLGNWLLVDPAPAGMHLVARRGPGLPRACSDTDLSTLAAGLGLTVLPLSACHAGPMAAGRAFGLVFGYAGVPEAVAETALARLGRAFAAHCAAAGSD
ncbi:PLP-dependent aminotransferase family protein [Marinibaculum pumilum]|uniref:PLP-dependent aminotransferase family protein n=1 Tax=Marinibaculum pumilum TaxID=1766165 RepID=A0ABV7KTS0_9PROT